MPRSSGRTTCWSTGAKVAGILAQSADGVAVVGIGLNVSLTREELPVPTASSLQLAGATGTLNRSALLGGILARLGEWLERWTGADGAADASGLADAYRGLCATLGSDVRITLGEDRVLEGYAVDIDDSGRIVIRTNGTTQAVGAGDVEHLRPNRRA